MSDHSELKRLAEHAMSEYPAWYTVEQLSFRAVDEAEYVFAASPAVVLALIADNERLKTTVYAVHGAGVAELHEQISQLKAENKRLAALLECAEGDLKLAMQIIEKNGKDAERYRWLRDPDNQEDLEADSDYLMPPIICGYAEHEDILSMDSLDKAIDDAMSKEG